MKLRPNVEHVVRTKPNIGLMALEVATAKYGANSSDLLNVLLLHKEAMVPARCKQHINHIDSTPHCGLHHIIANHIRSLQESFKKPQDNVCMPAFPCQVANFCDFNDNLKRFSTQCLGNFFNPCLDHCTICLLAARNLSFT